MSLFDLFDFDKENTLITETIVISAILMLQLYEVPQSQTFGAQTEFNQKLFSNAGTGTSAGTDAST